MSYYPNVVQRFLIITSHLKLILIYFRKLLDFILPYISAFHNILKQWCDRNETIR